MKMSNKINDFIDYCFDFYGAGGIYDFNMTREELLHGLTLRIMKRPDFSFVGDSIDREFVRDEVLKMRGEV